MKRRSIFDSDTDHSRAAAHGLGRHRKTWRILAEALCAVSALSISRRLRVFCASLLLLSAGCTYREEHSYQTITASKLRILNELIFKLNEKEHEFTAKDDLQGIIKASIKHGLISQQNVDARRPTLDGWDEEMIATVSCNASQIVIEVTDSKSSKYLAKSVIDKDSRRIVQEIGFESRR